MEFASQEETALAMVLTARWLPVLVRSFEKGVQDLGLAVTERSHFVDQDGKACPTLGVRGRRLIDETYAKAQARIRELAGRFEWLRAVFVEDAQADGPGNAASPPERRKPVCKLVGTDGNVFAIIGRVREEPRRAGQAELASEFVQQAFRAGSYDEVLRLCMEYVEVR